MRSRKNIKRKILILVVMILVIFQWIQPRKNQSPVMFGDNDISLVHELPAGLHTTLVNKCYDCHSNNTRYPWYAHVQPIGWWLAAHVHDGKEELNFSEFRQYSPSAAEHKLEELMEVAEHRAMPLKSYLLLHREAELTDRDVEMITAWVKATTEGG